MGYFMSNKNSIFFEYDFDSELDYENVKYNELGNDGFGYFDLSEAEEDFPPSILKICSDPKNHHFKQKFLFYSSHRECVYCGYSPELDYAKKEFEECHNKFLIWEKNKK
jgi:hypothetical protein